MLRKQQQKKINHTLRKSFIIIFRSTFRWLQKKLSLVVKPSVNAKCIGRQPTVDQQRDSKNTPGYRTTNRINRIIISRVTCPYLSKEIERDLSMNSTDIFTSHINHVTISTVLNLPLRKSTSLWMLAKFVWSLSH